MHLPEEELIGNFSRVEIGDSIISDFDASHRVTLGSCVGVCLHWKSLDRYALAHVLLPSRKSASRADKYPDSRFGDTVGLYLLNTLEVPRARYRQVDAYIAGGANLYDSRAQVGDQNSEQVLRSLAALRVRVRKQDIGGTTSRQMAVVGPKRTVLSLLLDDNNTVHRWPLRIAS